MMTLSRRQALVMVGAVTAMLHGKPTEGSQGGLTLALDSVEAILLKYRGRTVVVTPGQIMDALDVGLAQMRK